MKRILLIICVLCLIVSCSDSEKAIPVLSVNPSILEFDNTESTKKIYIDSNILWSSSCDQTDWCTASKLQKYGNDTVDIHVLENRGAERIAHISFSNPEKTIIKTLKVVQKEPGREQ